jgi:hypothetical protein
MRNSRTVDEPVPIRLFSHHDRYQGQKSDSSNQCSIRPARTGADAERPAPRILGLWHTRARSESSVVTYLGPRIGSSPVCVSGKCLGSGIRHTPTAGRDAERTVKFGASVGSSRRRTRRGEARCDSGSLCGVRLVLCLHAIRVPEPCAQMPVRTDAGHATADPHAARDSAGTGDGTAACPARARRHS